jgi:hypothetical protein
LWTVDPRGGKPARLTRTRRVAELMPAWSPDGREIAYDAMVRGQYDIFALDVSERTTRHITDDVDDDGDPFWSPDGAQIVFRRAVDEDYELAVTATSGSGRPRIISREPAGIDLAPSWSVAPAGAVASSVTAHVTAVAWTWVCDVGWRGTPHADNYPGNGHDNKMCGLEGRDTISGGKGADWISGGSGNDQLYGVEHNDKLKSRESSTHYGDDVGGGLGYDLGMHDAKDAVRNVEAPNY